EPGAAQVGQAGRQGQVRCRPHQRTNHRDHDTEDEVGGCPPTRFYRRSATNGRPDWRCASIASSEWPVVSGTRAVVKTIPPRQMTAKIVKVAARPTPESISGKANTTMVLKPQLLIDAMLMPGPRTRSGKISDIMTCGSGPMATANEAM